MPGRMGERIRESRKRRSEWKSEKDQIRELGAARMRILLDNYAPHLSELEKQELVGKFRKRISAYKSFAGFLAAHPTGTAIVAGGTAALSALAATVPAPAVPMVMGGLTGFLVTISARFAKALFTKEHTKQSGGYSMGRVTINARAGDRETLRDTMDHEGVHWLMARMAPKHLPSAVQEGVAMYISSIPNAEDRPTTSKLLLESGVVKGHSIRGLWYRHKELTRKDRKLNRIPSASHYHGGEYIRDLGEELSGLVGKDAHKIMAKNLLQGKTLEKAVRDVGREHGTDKGVIERFIKKYKPPIS